MRQFSDPPLIAWPDPSSGGLLDNPALFPEPWPFGCGRAAVHRSCLVGGMDEKEKRHAGTRQILVDTCGYRATSGSMAHDHDLEQGSLFSPRYDRAGLIAAVVQNAETLEVLMVAFMDEEALAATQATGFAHFHSRSRGRLWMKGEESGNRLRVEQLWIDCDQDAVLLLVNPAGPTCHTGATSCFYRRIDGQRLVCSDD